MAVAIAAGIVIAVGAGVAVGLLTRPHQSTPSTGSSSNPSPTSAAQSQALAAYHAAISTMRGSTGFHYVARTGGAGPQQQIVGDAGASSGRQLITLNASYGDEQFTLLLMNGLVYFRGNGPALQDQLGVSAAKAPSLVNKWISVAKGDGPYNVLQPGITISDQADETALQAESTSAVTESDGTNALRITGKVPPQQGAPSGTGYLDVATSSHQPIVYASTIAANGVTLTSTTTFSKWGAAPSVTVPTVSATWASLGATEPPGGYGSGGAPGGGATPSPPGSL